jgi:hypothetical protein
MIFEKHDALSHEQCESLISLFERHKNFQSQGKTIGGLNLEVKDCTEVLFSPEYHELNDMFAALQVGLDEYEERYPFLKTLNRYGQVENITFKRYNPGQAYHGTHCERSGLKTCARMLVWMFYLNDVHDGGETFFPHQAKRVKARQGKLVIWPSDWTHAHYGLVSNTETKYIISSWFSFV